MVLQLVLSKAYEDSAGFYICYWYVKTIMYLPMTISIVFCVHLVCAALRIDLAVCKADCL